VSVRFLVSDTLTGTYLGDLEPSRWSLQDPLSTSGTGELTLPLPADTDAAARVADLTQRHIRSVAVQDDQGRFLWGGPIPRRPARNGGEITVPLIDWRGWFYRAPIRPNVDGTRHNYIKTGVNAREQCLIMTDLATLALNTLGAPYMVVDAAPISGTTRELTALMLDRTTGDFLQSIQERDNGCEWWTYVTWDGDETSNRLLPHFAVAWPERASRGVPIRVEFKAGKGGNVHDYSWPEGEDTPTRVWALGEGEPPEQVFVVDEYPELEDGTEVAWESVIGPFTGETVAATVFEHAFGAIQASRGLDGQAEFSIIDERLPIGDVMTGDRARIVLDDGWISADVEAARIVARTISGGREQPTMQRITLALSDALYPDQADPGTAVE
jgi:hypothetical protein